MNSGGTSALRLDAISTESQFLDHVSPLWQALPEALRGQFLVAPELMARAKARGIEATPITFPPYVANPPPRHGGPVALVASAGDIKHGRRLGYGPFVFLEHGAGQSYGQNTVYHGAYAGGPDRDDVILNLVPNETCAERWRAAYPATPTVVIGCPKLDELPEREPGLVDQGMVCEVFCCNRSLGYEQPRCIDSALDEP